MAILVSSDFHKTLLFVAFDGLTVTDSPYDSFIATEIEDLLSEMLVTAIGSLTVTLHSPYLPLPSTAEHLIIVLPTPTAVTLP